MTETSKFARTEDLTLHAHWTLNSFIVTFDANGGSVGTESLRAYCGEALGELPTPTRDHYTFDGWYTLAAGGEKVTAETTYAEAADITLYARWNIIPYTVSWNAGTNCTITVQRTSSPNAGAGTGNLSSGAAVYYGDVLSVSYSANTGYSLSTKGVTSVTVTGNVTASQIYASATANNYTYKVVYKSSNNTDLGSTTVTKAFGTTNTISAPAKTGYNTPGSQSVKWDSTSAKTITFTYTPIPRSTSQSVASGTWTSWKSSSGRSYGIDYSVKAEYRNRTANSVQVRLVWTNTITANSYFGYGQWFTGKIGGTSTGEIQICTSSTWASQSSSARSQTASSGWITVSVSPTTTSVSLSATFRDQDGTSSSWSGKSITIPTY